MTETTKPEELGRYLWRAGKRIDIVELPDRFTVRMKRGIAKEKVATDYHATHRRRLRRQNLDEFSVGAEDRDAVMERVRRGSEVEFASHVYAPADEPQAKLYLTDQITVQFKPEVSDDEIEKFTTELGLTLVKEVRGVSRAYVFRVGPQAAENPIKIANRLAESDKVLVSEPNVAIASQSYYTPTDTLFPDQWHLFNTGGPLLSNDGHIDAVHAWDLTRGERAVIWPWPMTPATSTTPISRGRARSSRRGISPARTSNPCRNWRTTITVRPAAASRWPKKPALAW